MKRLSIYLIILSFCFSLNTLAFEKYWSAKGHRVVVKIADSYLTGKTKRAINKLLNNQSLALVSTYGDDIKSDRRYNEFYTWHYINMPLDIDYEDSKKNPNGDLVSGINYCITMIKDDNASNEDKAFYLKLLIHFIGDLHQPMHVGLEEAKGVNDFKLKWFFKDSNLHRACDKEMIYSYDMSFTELANNADVLTKQQVKAIQKGSIVGLG